MSDISVDSVVHILWYVSFFPVLYIPVGGDLTLQLDFSFSFFSFLYFCFICLGAFVSIVPAFRISLSSIWLLYIMKWLSLSLIMLLILKHASNIQLGIPVFLLLMSVWHTSYLPFFSILYFCSFLKYSWCLMFSSFWQSLSFNLILYSIHNIIYIFMHLSLSPLWVL